MRLHELFTKCLSALIILTDCIQVALAIDFVLLDESLDKSGYFSISDWTSSGVGFNMGHSPWWNSIISSRITITLDSSSISSCDRWYTIFSHTLSWRSMGIVTNIYCMLILDWLSVGWKLTLLSQVDSTGLSGNSSFFSGLNLYRNL